MSKEVIIGEIEKGDATAKYLKELVNSDKPCLTSFHANDGAMDNAINIIKDMLTLEENK